MNEQYFTFQMKKQIIIFWFLQGTLAGDAIGSIIEFNPYPFSCEALKHIKACSRRTNDDNWLVYNLDSNWNVVIFACVGHYEE